MYKETCNESYRLKLDFFFLWAILTLIQFLDLFTTFVGLTLFEGREKNPLVVYAISNYGMAALGWIKFLVIALSGVMYIVVLMVKPRVPPPSGERLVRTTVILSIVSILFCTVVVANNLYQMLKVV